MTTPEPVKQKNTKAWIALIGGVLASAVPFILQLAGALPPPWGAIASGVGLIINAVTGKTVQQVSNAPKGYTMAPVPATNPDGTYQKGW